MNYLEANSAPGREDRLKANVAFVGTCKQLHQCGKKGCMQMASRSFSQTQGCQFTLSLAILNTLRNAVIIMHGPIGCGACSTGSIGIAKTAQRLRDPDAAGVIWLNTNLDEADVIGGGEKKLREAILYAESEFRPETIIVAVACVPALIGDDVDSILDDLQKQTSAILVPIHCEGFKTKIMATAYDAVYHGILKKYIRDPQRRDYLTETDQQKLLEKYRISRNVNVMNVSSMSYFDEVELKRLLSALGLNVNFIPCYTEPDDFKYALETSLNVSICGTHDDYFVEHLKEKYNIPFIVDTIPIGRKNTARWIRNIAKHFGLEAEAERLIEAEDKAIAEAIEPFKANLSGKKVFLAGGEVRVVSTSEIMQDLGLKVVGLKGYHYDHFVEPIFEQLEDSDDIIFNVATGQTFEQANLVNSLKPDIFVAHPGGQNITSKYGLPILPLFGPAYNYLGYAGIFEIARKLNRVIKNSQFNKKLSQHKPLPYNKQWYSKDPFTYIKDLDRE